MVRDVLGTFVLVVTVLVGLSLTLLGLRGIGAPPWAVLVAGALTVALLLAWRKRRRHAENLIGTERSFGRGAL